MNLFRRCTLIAVGLAASPFLFASAPHPTVLTAKYHGAFHPVIRVIESDPVVYVDGKEHRISSTPTYIADRTADYAPNRVRVGATFLSSHEIATVPAESAQAGGTDYIPHDRMGFGTRYFDAKLEAKETLSGGFIVVTMISPKIFEPGAEFIRPSLLVHDLPDLPAGKTVHVKVSAPASGGLANVQYFVQIFDSRGFEVHTNQHSLAWKYYALVDHVKQRYAVKKYMKKYAKADHAAMPFIVIKPDFPDSFKPPAKTIIADMSIDANGEVSSVTFESMHDEITRRALQRALDGWLFLPKLKAGRPVPTKVKVPLTF